MPIHRLRYDVNLTAIDDIELVQTAMEWLIGPEGVIATKRDTTHHGGRLHRLRTVFDRPGPARRALARLGPHLLEELARTLPTRIDEEKRIHFRLDLVRLVCGRICLAEQGPVVKARFKLRVQPGDVIEAVADRLIFDAVDRAERSHWPPPFPTEGS